MIRATTDANVVVAGFVTKGSIPARIIQAWRRSVFELVVSEHILAEAAQAWQRPCYRTRFATEESRQAIGLLCTEAIVTPIVEQIQGVAPQAADDLGLATAVSGGADYLVTGDKGLLAVGDVRGVRIITPRMFLVVLGIERS